MLLHLASLNQLSQKQEQLELKPQMSIEFRGFNQISLSVGIDRRRKFSGAQLSGAQLSGAQPAIAASKVVKLA